MIWPDLSSLKPGTARDLENLEHNLKRIVVEGAGLLPVGPLRHTLDFANNSHHNRDGVFSVIPKYFGGNDGKDLFDRAQKVNSFRNTYIAHQVKEWNDVKLSEENLKIWIGTLAMISQCS